MHETRNKVLACFTLALGVSIATALLNVSLDIGDRMTEELKQYGANIVLAAKDGSLPLEIGEIDFNPFKNRSFIKEEYLTNLREIFWRYNIKAFTPYLTSTCQIDNHRFEIVGTWFEKENTFSTGEVFIEGIKKTRPYLGIKGGWIRDNDDHNTALVNEAANKYLSLSPGESAQITIYGPSGPRHERLLIKGIIEGDDSDKARIYVRLKFLQDRLDLAGKIQEIEVSAITTPDNELSKMADENPDSLTSAQFETWYCTAYVGSVAFQIEEVMPGVSAKPIRRVAEAEGSILKKLKILMVLLTVLALSGSALGIWSLMTTTILERTPEIGLVKAIGADSWRLAALFIAEIIIISIFASLLGWVMGIAFSVLISKGVFGHVGTVKPIILPFVFLLATATAVMGSISPIKFILRLKPIEVLHAR